ncbi:MAG: hypothetical protein HFG14_12105 [Lachnospiraceae bacterium]|jgi:hypothetical protein|nr:hypothetical protein [Lachnospiraceae bacterium]MCI9570594.1 hypothetical protein [Lachnospiraceae bacterium]
MRKRSCFYPEITVAVMVLILVKAGDAIWRLGDRAGRNLFPNKPACAHR